MYKLLGVETAIPWSHNMANRTIDLETTQGSLSDSSSDLAEDQSCLERQLQMAALDKLVKERKRNDDEWERVVAARRELEQEREALIAEHAKLMEQYVKGHSELIEARNSPKPIMKRKVAKKCVEKEKVVRAEGGSKVERKAPKFDGKIPVREFMLQFEACRRHNAWDDAESGFQLLMSCTDEALTALTINDITPDCEEYNYHELVKILEQELDSKECAESYFLQLTRRHQQQGETLQALGQDIKKLVKLAYPKTGKGERDRMAKDYFKTAIRDPEVRKDVFRSRPTTLDAAISIAIESESFARMELTERSRGTKMLGIRSMEAAAQQPPPLPEQRPRSRQVCYYCGETGHVQRQCVVKKRAEDVMKSVQYYGCGGYGYMRHSCPASYLPQASQPPAADYPPHQQQGNRSRRSQGPQVSPETSAGPTL